MNAKVKIVSCAVLIVLVVIVATAVDVWADYQETMRQRQTAVMDLTRVAESQIRATVKQAESFLDELGDMIVREGGARHMAEQRPLRIMRGICKGVGGCNFVSVINAQGVSVANTAVDGAPLIDVSDRAYFQAPQKTRAVFVGPAIVARLPGNPVQFHISKAVYDAGGAFLGVVSMGMNTEHFTAFYQLMGFALGPTITVFNRNGDVVARHPDIREHIGKNYGNGPLFREQLPKANSGVYDSVSILDGKTRLAAYRAIPEYDLVIFAGVDEAVAYKVWRTRTERSMALVAFALLVIAGALFFSFRSIRRQHMLELKNRELDLLTNIDGLTGLANRRRFDDVLHRDWAQHARTGSPLSLLMIDIDRFKSYNDYNGHQAGDECLRQVGRALQSTLQRESDLIARYGGEEFVAVLHCDDKGAEVVARKMQLAVAALALPHAGSDIGTVVTMSIGIAMANGAGMSDCEACIEAADKALYLAKERGRNRIEVRRTSPQLTLVAVD
ncbi:sensor domain-containing diguanylate cyclase [Noviherbaspirillum galbum]|uniref:diguanylate cyclase n=1 Tax=Noviherbaspirillum galbum TaxID=2709383 RepID=A0A6B3SV61_9BURK|nr:sensor domain-containing diguanylate cyclase [Noviherbaspirillum galbum]NEX64617.1 sensor domain-containing diguanylate cyclase [Noviherbaspirillum galbum]